MISASIPGAFGERGLAFAIAYGAFAIAPKFFMLWALKRHDAGNYRNFVINNAAFANAFIGSVAMWAIYFNIGAERGSRLIAHSDDPGRLARSGYTYLYVLMVAGIIVAAVGDELMLHHPGGHSDLKTAAVILAGPALYLVLLALLAPASPALTPLALSAAANAVLIAVAIWEWISIGRKAEAMRSE